jgi:hypothetical protein
VIYQSLGCFTTSYEISRTGQHRTSLLMAFESTLGRKALLLDHIESRRRGEGDSQVPGAPSSYLSSILPDKDFSISSQRHCIITSIFVWAKENDETSYGLPVSVTSHIKQNDFPARKTGHFQAASISHSAELETFTYLLIPSNTFLPFRLITYLPPLLCASYSFWDLQQGLRSELCSYLELPPQISSIACASRWTD